MKKQAIAALIKICQTKNVRLEIEVHNTGASIVAQVVRGEVCSRTSGWIDMSETEPDKKLAEIVGRLE